MIGGHILRISVFADMWIEHPRETSESTSYLTQLSKAKATIFPR